MLNGNDYYRECHRFLKLIFYVAKGIFIAWRSIGEKILESIVRHHDYPDVDFTLLKAIPQVNNITDEKVTSRRNLDLYPDSGEKRTIITHSFYPIDATS